MGQSLRWFSVSPRKMALFGGLEFVIMVEATLPARFVIFGQEEVLFLPREEAAEEHVPIAPNGPPHLDAQAILPCLDLEKHGMIWKDGSFRGGCIVIGQREHSNLLSEL
jgi:hypothetical protein